MENELKEKSHDETSSWPTLGGDINIPLDLQVEILKKLPAKSLLRFRSVSKQWSSIISSCRDFIESIVTRTTPRLDAHIFGNCVLALSSSTTTCPLNTDKKELFLIHMGNHQPVRGLICSSSSYEVSIYNPTTRQSFYLPKVEDNTSYGSFSFGYDPLENQYKVVFRRGKNCHVFTLGDGTTAKQWRAIEGYYSKRYFHFRGVVCINGTIYYPEVTDNKLTSFDVRSERFHQVEAPTEITDHSSTLINYQGKLGFICCEEGIEIWVMETQGWSNIFYYEMESFDLCVSGVTRDGEIVFNNRDDMFNRHAMFFVWYYDPKRNSKRYVDIQDYNKYVHCTSVVTLPDLCENTMCLK